jgi:hypothetical protein
MGSAYGLFLLSAHLESQTVPGDHARFVQTATQHFVKAALEVEQSAQRASSDPVKSAAESADAPTAQGGTANGKRRTTRTLSPAQIESVEICFCLEGGETSALLERAAATDRAAYEEIEAVLKSALHNDSLVASSLETARAMKLAMQQESTDVYYLTRRAVEGARYLEVQSPRGCLEITLGRKLSDDEWNGPALRAMRELFERAWADHSPFKSPTLTWTKAETKRQYLHYLRREYRGK